MPNWLPLEEVAKYLKMGKSTLYDLAHKIPRECRFHAPELAEWLRAGRLTSPIKEALTESDRDGKVAKSPVHDLQMVHEGVLYTNHVSPRTPRNRQHSALQIGACCTNARRGGQMA